MMRQEREGSAGTEGLFMTVLVQIVVQAFVGILFAWTNLIGG